MHRRRPSEFPLPQASVLNAAISSRDLWQLLSDTTLQTCGPNSISRGMAQTRREPVMLSAGGDDAENPPESSSNTLESLRNVAVEESFYNINNIIADTNSPSVQRHHRRASSVVLLNEWSEDVDVRDLYGAAMPANLLPEDSALLQNSSQLQQRGTRMREQSFRWWASTNLGQLSEDESQVNLPLMAGYVVIL